MVIVGLSEKLFSNNSKIFFNISAKLLGVVSAICSCIVWLPQIIKLIRTKKQGNLSLLMFIMQTPGNAVIIVFQLLYHQNWTTWITYAVGLAEQGTIVVILLVFMWRDRNDTDLEIEDMVGILGPVTTGTEIEGTETKYLSDNIDELGWMKKPNY